MNAISWQNLKSAIAHSTHTDSTQKMPQPFLAADKIRRDDKESQQKNGDWINNLSDAILLRRERKLYHFISSLPLKMIVVACSA